MTRSKHDVGSEKRFINDSFSPLFLAGMMGRGLPTPPVDFILQKITDNLCKNHPAVINRLTPLVGKVFLINPHDLPYQIRLEFDPDEIRACLDIENEEEADVHISGTLKSLISMLNGKEDGDALFFSRKIIVEGDTEALLTLRNALDSDDIDFLGEINAAFGIFRKPVAKMIDLTGKLTGKLDQELNQINKAMVDPLLIRLAAQQKHITRLNDKVTHLEKENQKIKKSIQSLRKKR